MPLCVSACTREKPENITRCNFVKFLLHGKNNRNTPAGLVRLVKVVIFVLLVGGVLRFCLPVTLQLVGRTQGDASSSAFRSHSVANSSPLRGTVYDRNFRELAVSYEVYSLYVNPVKVLDHGSFAEQLSSVLPASKQEVLRVLRKVNGPTLLADNLSPGDVKAVAALNLPGVSYVASEARFYPDYMAAPHLVGCSSDGVGISGMEAEFDGLLKPGIYQSSMFPEIDFQGNSHLGEAGSDLVLTIDLQLQKALEDSLREAGKADDATNVMGLLFDAGTGRVVAIANYPSFNANYFWRFPESVRKNRAVEEILSSDLLRSLLLRAKVVLDKGGNGALLPETVAAPQFGLTGTSSEQLWDSVFIAGFGQESSGGDAAFGNEENDGEGLVSLVEMGSAIASIVNGGWLREPVFVDSVYDVASKSFFMPDAKYIDQRMIFPSPDIGIILRRGMKKILWAENKNQLEGYSSSQVRVVKHGFYNSYTKQELFASFIPGNKPDLLLLLAVERQGVTVEKKDSDNQLALAGDKVISSLPSDISPYFESVASYPGSKNKENMERFFISRRIVGEKQVNLADSDVALEMPEVVGMSLRQGLRSLQGLSCQLVIEGRGEVVSQFPPAGETVKSGGECRLVLANRG